MYYIFIAYIQIETLTFLATRSLLSRATDHHNVSNLIG